MAVDPLPLDMLQHPHLEHGTMLLALTGWMDGGLVSTGTVRRLLENRHAPEIARLAPDLFYLYNFPGSMEIAALFRPEVRMNGGLVQEFTLPVNQAYCDSAANLLFFLGKEPNLRWQLYADSLFHLAHEVGITRIVFIGSFGGTVPHTREPRLYASVSHDHLKSLMQEHNLRPSDYEGPAGFSTMLLAQSPQHHIEMISLVAEIPGYLQGINPVSIEAVARRLARLLNIPVDLDALRQASTAWELQVSDAVAKDPKLADTVRQLEERYDNELIGQADEAADEENPEEDEG